MYERAPKRPLFDRFVRQGFGKMAVTMIQNTAAAPTGTAPDGNFPTGVDATRKLALHAATLSFDNLPQDLVEMIKRCVLDTLGVTIGARALVPQGQILNRHRRDKKIGAACRDVVL